MATRYLLDTNTITALANREPNAVAHLRSLASDDELFSCFIVTGEWEYGILNAPSARRQAEIRAAGDVVFSSLDGIWESNPDVSREYGALAARLRAAGQQIPTNDLWLAAVARAYYATLVTTDPHFGRIPDLAQANWSVP